MKLTNFLSLIKKIQNEANSQVDKEGKPVFYGKFILGDDIKDTEDSMKAFKQDYFGIIKRLNIFTGLENEKEEELIKIAKSFF